MAFRYAVRRVKIYGRGLYPSTSFDVTNQKVYIIKIVRSQKMR